ncbi:hypothetical protein [Aliamphritea hakodatensis]|uniref:hypothetical protein n=1 Tax=Aliamphritea hakodatensis TaxID=2895352 RepID=UPI0022FD576F|nr:hypothetical protein [Aliamphritea hakodatensis]
MSLKQPKQLKALLAGAVSLVVLSAVPVAGVSAEEGFKGAKDWVSGAPDQLTKDKRLEKYLRGFDQPMWEVGERYDRMEQALIDENYELAQYHWKKIRITLENGLMKRPGRRANAEAILLNRTWSEVRDALATEDPAIVKAGFQKAKNACMACHAAERVAYMNDQPLFMRDGFLADQP